MFAGRFNIYSRIFCDAIYGMSMEAPWWTTARQFLMCFVIYSGAWIFLTGYTTLLFGGSTGREYYKSCRYPAYHSAHFEPPDDGTRTWIGYYVDAAGKNGLTLTDDGIFFRQRAQEIIELADRLEKSFVERQNDISGMVVIGAPEAVGSQTLDKLIKVF